MSEKFRRGRWFCNRDLSPPPLQCADLSSSTVPTNIDNIIEEDSINKPESETSTEGDQGSIYEPTDDCLSSTDSECSKTFDSSDDSEICKRNFSRTCNPIITKLKDSANNDSTSNKADINKSDQNIFLSDSNSTDSDIHTLVSSEDRMVEPTANKLKKGNKCYNFCYFCETLVLNFSRHLFRNHSLEVEVQQILALPPNNKKRKELLTLLRKRGNYLNSNSVQKPIKKPILDTTNLLPCDNCLGFYASKQLWRHRKTCLDGKPKTSALKSAQSLIIKNLKIDPKLVESVFPRMRPDHISLEAKRDRLICAFASRYIKIHREKHFINVASRKMRELSKILLELKKQLPHVKNLFECLKPQYFDNICMATKIIAKYDIENDRYKSPSLAMQMGTTLKQCCEIAITYALKKKDIYCTIPSAEAEADLNMLIKLIDSHWKYEISSQAANDLKINQWNKVTIIPLATDLKLLRNYLITTANDFATKLSTDNSNKNHYLGLLETIFCRVILLNRRRPGELQRLLLTTYLENESEKQNYEEFSEVINETEKILMKRFKRVVVRGKRDRGVPILFDNDVQKHINLLLEHRKNFLSQKNIYLFGNPGTLGTITGYKVLQKLARKAGTQNPNAISATRLRKHLATLTQIFSMSENDMEQLAQFMGHTLGIHKGSYRLPNDVYQTAKISKLLLLMEKGEAGKFQGQSLNNIEVDMNEDLFNENLDTTDYIIPVVENIEIPEGDVPETISNVKVGSKRTLTAWTEEQKKVAKQFFAKHIKSKRPPKKYECMELKEKYKDLFNNKDWLKLKVFIQNEYQKKK